MTAPLRRATFRPLTESHGTMFAILRISTQHGRLTLAARSSRMELALFAPQAQPARRSITTSRALSKSNRARDVPPEPPTPAAALGALSMQMRQSFMTLGDVFKGRNLRMLFRAHPEEFVIAVFILLMIAGGVGSIIYLYFTYFYSEQFTRYPPEVAKTLRRALYYGDHAPDPPTALKYYQKAIRQCHEHGLDPFSDEVMGIKIRLAQWLQKINQFDPAIDVLERTLAENQKWLATAETAPASLPRDKSLLDGTPALPEQQRDTQPESDDEFEQWLRAARTRILGKSVGISTKLGELYSDEHVLQQDKAHEKFIWAVETALAEFRRRTTEGVSPADGSWMSPEEIGGTLEYLAHSYEKRGQFELALPLFFQALRLCSDRCHMAILMNNLAVSFAQHPLRIPFEASIGINPNDQQNPPTVPATVPTRPELLESAQRWAQNAYSHADSTSGDARTPECDQACVVALINLGDIASMMGRKDEARRIYQDGADLSTRLGFDDGVTQAQSGLLKLK